MPARLDAAGGRPIEPGAQLVLETGIGLIGDWSASFAGRKISGF